jgi:hypothetical protein
MMLVLVLVLEFLLWSTRYIDHIDKHKIITCQHRSRSALTWRLLRNWLLPSRFSCSLIIVVWLENSRAHVSLL